MAAKKGIGAGAVIQFIGSLVFLYVLWSWWTAGWVLGSAGAAWFGGAGGFWAPIFAAVAIFGAIALFLMSIVALMGTTGGDMAKYTGKIVLGTSLSFFALTAGGGLFIPVIIAFVLSYWGNGMQMMK